MAEEKYEPRELNLNRSLPWLQLFRGFQIAIDPRKLLLAAAGIFLMALGWWFLSYVFDSRRPEWKDYEAKAGSGAVDTEWGSYKADLDDWNLRHRAAGAADSDSSYYEPGDVASSYQEFETIRQLTEERKEPGSGSGEVKKINRFDQARAELDAKLNRPPRPQELADYLAAPDQPVSVATVRKIQTYRLDLPREERPKKATGEIRTLPWSEYRGPNPALLVAQRTGPESGGALVEWLTTNEAPVLLEPLFKFLRPIVYFLHPAAGWLTRFYFLLVILWTVAVWSLFGGAITRMAAVEFARREKVGIADAFKFAYRRWVSYLSAPLFPLFFVAVLVVVMMIFGVINLIPAVGEFINGILWPIILVLGLLMAIVLVGLVGWPMMSATISAEGTDSWEAVSRSYSYIFQAPWHYLWYGVVAILYGAVLVFFVGFMGSLTTYLGRWAFAETPFSSSVNREPAFLFVYTPTSFGWRDLLLSGGQTKEGQPLVTANGTVDKAAYDNYVGSMKGYNQLGAWLVAFWVGLFFLMIVGFGYSYFWTASTIIYFLMRKKVDDAELDEVYLEEEEHDTFFTPPKPVTPTSPPVKSSTASLQMVEAPSLRTPSSSSPVSATTATYTTAPAAPSATGTAPALSPSSLPASEGPVSTTPPSGDGNSSKESH